MENVNDLQIRAFYERLKALNDGGVIVNGLMVLSQSRFEDLLETYRTYFFDAISDFDDESYHEPLSYGGAFDSLKEKLDDIENNVDSLEALTSNENKDEPMVMAESSDGALNLSDSDSESETEPEEKTETVESEVDPVVANAFGVKNTSVVEDSEVDNVKSKDTDTSDVVVEVKSESEESHEDVKSENDSFSAGKTFTRKYDRVDSQMESDSDQDVKSSAEVLASEVVNSESSLESLDDSELDNVAVDDSDAFASGDIHVTSNNIKSDEDDEELDLDVDSNVDGLLDHLPVVTDDNSDSDEN